MMYALIISTLVLTLAGVSLTKAACPVCEAAAKDNLPVNGTIVAGAANEVCCSSGGVNYFCQTMTAAKATGGLLNGLSSTLNNILPGVSDALCSVVKIVENILKNNLSAVLSCLEGVTVTCTPPPVPTTPVTPTSPYCASLCTDGVCCTTNGCA